jgi:hypothetical protein
MYDQKEETPSEKRRHVVTMHCVYLVSPFQLNTFNTNDHCEASLACDISAVILYSIYLLCVSIIQGDTRSPHACSASARLRHHQHSIRHDANIHTHTNTQTLTNTNTQTHKNTNIQTNKQTKPGFTNLKGCRNSLARCERAIQRAIQRAIRSSERSDPASDRGARSAPTESARRPCSQRTVHLQGAVTHNLCLTSLLIN